MTASWLKPAQLMRTSRWQEFQKERFPVAKMAMIPLGMSASGFAAAGGWADDFAFKLSLACSIGGIYAFLVELRLMDELKDFEKDKIAHPTRPLPRGLIPVAELELMIRAGLAALVLLAGVVFFAVNAAAALLLAVCVGYLYLMYKEFFIGQALGRRPFWYAVSHQIVIFPLICFAVACRDAEAWSAPQGLWLATLILGAFFTYEVGRKLDPRAHPLLMTYLVVYGKTRTALMVVGAMMLSAWAAHALEIAHVLWPVQALVLAGLPLLWLKPEKFKILEGLATLSLLAHLWAYPISRYWA